MRSEDGVFMHSSSLDSVTVLLPGLVGSNSSSNRSRLAQALDQCAQVVGGVEPQLVVKELAECLVLAEC